MKQLLLLFLILLLSILQAQSLKDIKYPNAIIEQVTSIYDGDTFRANIRDYPPIVGHRMAIRVKGIDTPEMKAKCKIEKILARKAKQQTVMMLRGAKTIELRNISRGKYFRLVVDVYVDDVNLSQILLDSKLAIIYDGKTKTNGLV